MAETVNSKLYHNFFVLLMVEYWFVEYLSIQGFILPPIDVSEWSIAHCQGYIRHVPGPLPVFPVLWVLFRRTCTIVWRPL